VLVANRRALEEQALGEALAPESLAQAIPSDEIWFDQILGSASVTEADAEAVARFVATAIFDPGSTADVASDSSSTDAAPRMVFISISDGASVARVVRGSGRGVAAAVDQALEQARALVEDGYQPRWIKVDIVQESLQLTDIDPEDSLDHERSLYGLAFDRASGLAFLPEELVAHTLVDSDLDLRFDRIADYLEESSVSTNHLRRLELSRPLPMYRFVTTGFFSDGEEIVQLFRGHRRFGRLSAEGVLSAAIAGGEYLTEAVRSNGKFVYSYLPKTDRVPDRYNILRHAGTVYSMLELYEVTGDVELLQAAERAIGYLRTSSLPCEVDDESVLCVVEDEEVKLGGAGLAAIALAKYTEVTGDERYSAELVALGRTMQALQHESGEFTHKITYPEGEDTHFVSQYYPGEALLALTRIYAIDPDEGWLDTAERGAQYLINVRDKGLSISQLTHDHWLLYALNELYRYRPNPTYRDHAAHIARAIMQSQNQRPEYPDWLGSYYRPPRSTSTATRTEGLCAAYRLVRDFGDPRTADSIFRAIELGVAFQLQTQFLPASVLYVSDPQRSLGGFHRSLTNFEIRIDYVQHNISSLLCAAHLLSYIIGT
jgi:hypothetical protein